MNDYDALDLSVGVIVLACAAAIVLVAITLIARGTWLLMRWAWSLTP